MKFEELEKKQDKIHKKIELIAINKQLIKKTPRVEPIYDGVIDIAKYIKSSPRIMWILKEAYGDYTSTGKITGGGWSFSEKFSQDNFLDGFDMWKIMIQINFAIHNNKAWKEIDYIENDPKMINEIKNIAYINVNKMPGESESKDQKLFESYKIWKDIIKEQIDLYKPELIIFGKTFQFFKDDFFHITEKPIMTVSGKWYSDLYKKDGMVLIDAFHPSRKGGEDTSSEYVNSIINAYKKLKDIK